MLKLNKHIDAGSMIVAAITLVLFLTALVLKGLSHEILLEAGVFLISVKLMMMVYKHSVSTEEVKRQLAKIAASLERLETRGVRKEP